MSTVGVIPGLVRIYSAFGYVDMSELDAITTCRRFPNDYTRTQWSHGDYPPVDVPQNWQNISGYQRLGLGRQIAGSGISTIAQADAVIADYIAAAQLPAA